VQEELYPLPHGSSEYEASAQHAPEREPFDDARLIDLESEQESPFLRGQKRVSARRGPLPKKTANRLKWIALALLLLAVLAAFSATLYSYGKHSWRFRIDSSDQIEVGGSQHVSHAQIMDVMGGDIGRNIFFVPLAQRKQQLEQIPWVESASVMRFVPNRLRIEIHERTPVAFVRIGSHISLIDAGGNLMELAPAAKHKYSFPVIAGMNANEPLSTRAVRMRNYNDLIQQLDSTGAHYSQEISEVDLNDTEDVKVLTSDADGEVLVHLGAGNYLQRYRIYVAHVQAWRQQFSKLDSVDLRYDGQIIVNPDLDGMVRQPALTQAAAKAALAAGVKNAAIVNYEKFVNHPAPPPAPPAKHVAAKSKTAVKPDAKLAAKAEPKIDRKIEPKLEPKTPAKSEAKAEVKVEAKSGQKTAASAQASVATKSDSKVAVKTNPVKASPVKAAARARSRAAAHHAVPKSRTKATNTKTAAARNFPSPHATIQPAHTRSLAEKSTAENKTAASKPPKPVAAPLVTAVSQKKPSPAILKEAPQN
jgi:cell division protein FtsQ